MAKTVYFPVINLKGTGSNIERCRRKAGLSVRDLQTYFGFEYPQAIYKWQHGECLPTVDNLLALSRILGVRMEDLLVYEDQEVFPSIRDGIDGVEDQLQALLSEPKMMIFSLTQSVIACAPGARSLRGSKPLP
ncbi:MAG: helix-turn-helix transcriptional regulator [Lachnospiraceae bacterium]|nr:helix-turn-helix transcriptional regulator [Lachnospiraceae bacterium]